MSSSSIRLRAACAGAAVAALLSAQDTPPSSFGESVTVRVVNVDVIAVDKDGLFVPDLRKEDFELLEDGKPVDIGYFALYGAGPASLPAAAQTPAGVEPPRAEAPIEPPPATYAVLVDQTLMQPGERNQLLDELESFLLKRLRPEDKVLLASYGGRMRVLSDLSTDRAALEHGLAELRRSPRPLNPVASRESILMRNMVNADSDARIRGVQVDTVRYEIETLAEEEARQSVDAVQSMSAFVDALSALDGRKALVYVGGGISSAPAARLVSQYTQRFPGAPEPETPRDLALRITTARTKMVARAGAGRVTFYVINADPDRGPSVVGPDEPGLVDGNFTGPATTRNEPERESSLAWLARGTGGRVWMAHPKMAPSLEDMRFDFAQYYSLGFAAHDAGVGHTLEVRSKRPGVQVRGRAAYRVPLPGEASGDAISSLLLGRRENPIGALLEWGEARREDGKGPLLVPMTVRVPVQKITFVSDGAQRQAKVSIDFAARDTDGSLYTMESREFPISIPEEKMAEALRQVVPFTFKLSLPKGNYRVLVAVRDQLAPSISAVTADLAVSKGSS
jgi:VWFA-related protein